MSQTLILRVLKELKDPASPVEIMRLAEREGVLDPGLENRGHVNRDVRALVKWGLARETPDRKYILTRAGRMTK